MQSTESTTDDLMRSALNFERKRQWEDAVELYARVIHIRPEWTLAYLCLGCALGKLDRTDAAAQVLSLGHDRNPVLFNAWRSKDVEREVAARSQYAEKLFRHFMTSQHNQSLRQYEAESGCGELVRVRSAVWCQTHDRPFDYVHPQQRPWLLYMPDLTPQPWFDAETLPWQQELARRFPAIQREVQEAMIDLADDVRPYVGDETAGSTDLKEIRGSLRWASIPLYQNGLAAKDHVLRAFPEILAALEAVDCVRMRGNPMEVVVSMLSPGTRIPGHFGLANTRAIVHLPLEVPDGCSLTVGGEQRSLREGMILAFDDGFWHEANNPSSMLRTHLIIHAWRPDLQGHEKAALTRCMEDRDRWNRERQVPAFEGSAQPRG